MSDQRRILIVLLECTALVLLWGGVRPLLLSLRRSAEARLELARTAAAESAVLEENEEEIERLQELLTESLERAGEVVLGEATAADLSQRLSNLCVVCGLNLERFSQPGEMLPIQTGGKKSRVVGRRTSVYLATAGSWPGAARFLLLQADRLPALRIARVQIDNADPDLGIVKAAFEMIAPVPATSDAQPETQ